MTNRAARSVSLSLLLVLSAGARAGAQELQPLPGGPARFEATVQRLADHVGERTVLIYGVIGLGSGAVVDPRGTVLTNAHVVAASRYAVLQWQDGRTVLARRRGIDYEHDLAVLEPERPLAGPVPCFSLADARPGVGQWVVAGGFPGGLRTTPQPTISLGTVTGRNEPGAGAQNVMGVLDYQGAIRSDVPIFSGNSGGPLVDLRGDLVGINGAVDLERATSLTIPVERLRAALEVLREGKILLPGGVALEAKRNPLLRAFFRGLDAFMKQMPERARRASEAAAEARQAAPERSAEQAAAERAAAEALARTARALPRERPLDAATRAPAALVSREGVLLTAVDARHAVTALGRLAGRDALELAEGRAAVIARDEAHDLALLRLPRPLRRPGLEAPDVPVGSLVSIGGADGPLASGIVSAPLRPTSAQVLAQIQEGGEQALGRALELFGRMARTLGSRELLQLVEQIEASLAARRRFASGTPPRSYPAVLSIDAPLPPSAVGAPVADRQGRVIGVATGLGHHGTAYVTPIHEVRRAFRSELGGDLVPRERGRARLY
ncbi:MAG: S1C family serine protease [Planctomycetota bacterium]